MRARSRFADLRYLNPAQGMHNSVTCATVYSRVPHEFELLELPQLSQDRIVQGANPVILIEKGPAHHALLVNDQDCRLGDFAIGVKEVICVNDPMLGV